MGKNIIIKMARNLMKTITKVEQLSFGRLYDHANNL